MLAFAQSPCRSVRDSVFSLGDSPELAGLRVQSFIDRRWGLDRKDGTWNPAPALLWPTVEVYSESSTDDEGDFWRSQGHSASHRYTSSTSSVNTSVLLDREDAETDDLEYKLPSLGTARLQSHRSMPIGRLVYLSKSPTQAATRHDNAGANMHSSRCSDWSRALSALLDYTWNEQCHEQVASAPLRRQTVHARQTSMSELPWFGSANGHPALTPPEMLSTQKRDKRQRVLGTHPDACNDTQANSQRPQTPVAGARRIASLKRSGRLHLSQREPAAYQVTKSLPKEV